MGPLINFLVLAVFLIVGLAQANVIPRNLGYGIAVPLGVVTFILAIVRYKQRKDKGE